MRWYVAIPTGPLSTMQFLNKLRDHGITAERIKVTSNYVEGQVSHSVFYYHVEDIM